MTSYEVRETYLNRTEDYQFGNSNGWVPVIATSKAELFRNCQDEYGRCTGKMYVDEKVFAGTVAWGVVVPPKYVTREVGWIFEKRMTYEDMLYRRPRRKEDTYMREVWVQVREEGEEVEGRPWKAESLEA